MKRIPLGNRYNLSPLIELTVNRALLTCFGDFMFTSWFSLRELWLSWMLTLVLEEKIRLLELLSNLS